MGGSRTLRCLFFFFKFRVCVVVLLSIAANCLCRPITSLIRKNCALIEFLRFLCLSVSRRVIAGTRTADRSSPGVSCVCSFMRGLLGNGAIGYSTSESTSYGGISAIGGVIHKPAKRTFSTQYRANLHKSPCMIARFRPRLCCLLQSIPRILLCGCLIGFVCLVRLKRQR